MLHAYNQHARLRYEVHLVVRARFTRALGNVTNYVIYSRRIAVWCVYAVHVLRLTHFPYAL